MKYEPDSLVERALRLLRGTPTVPVRSALNETQREQPPAPAPAPAPPPPDSTGENVVIEPAAMNAKPLYWERTGSIIGPGTLEFLAKVGDGPTAGYWVVAQYEGQPVWVNSIMLRSCREFERQVPLRVVELVKEPR